MTRDKFFRFEQARRHAPTETKSKSDGAHEKRAKIARLRERDVEEWEA